MIHATIILSCIAMNNDADWRQGCERKIKQKVDDLKCPPNLALVMSYVFAEVELREGHSEEHFHLLLIMIMRPFSFQNGRKSCDSVSNTNDFGWG